MFPNPQESLPLPISPSLERYKKIAKGYVVYSIGSDGIDSGGMGDSSGPWSRINNAPHDVTLTVEH